MKISKSLFPSKTKSVLLIMGAFYSMSCQAESTSFLCREEGKTDSIAFSWSPSAIHIDHMSFTLVKSLIIFQLSLKKYFKFLSFRKKKNKNILTDIPLDHKVLLKFFQPSVDKYMVHY